MTMQSYVFFYKQLPAHSTTLNEYLGVEWLSLIHPEYLAYSNKTTLFWVH